MTTPSINPDFAKLGLSRDLSGSGTTGATPSAASKIGKGPSALGVEDFMSLMVAQFKNQDPTKPVDNSQLIAQLASFSQVSGIDSLNKSMKSLSDSYAASQTVQAASLLGRNVLIDKPTGYIAAGGALEAAVDVPSGSQRVAVQITDSAGQVVRTLDLGIPPSGLAKFTWDGKTDAGVAAPAGQYTVNAQALVAGKAQSASAYVSARVESVTMGGTTGSGVTLSLTGLPDVTMTDVKQIS
jgi:flagellar basal-body rod modification protein FlgD